MVKVMRRGAIKLSVEELVVASDDKDTQVRLIAYDEITRRIREADSENIACGILSEALHLTRRDQIEKDFGSMAHSVRKSKVEKLVRG